MSLVKMKKQEFDSLSDEQLGWACMEPTFLQIRGKDMTVKSTVIDQLTKGQQALCMFRVMYDHAKHSAAEYYGWISCLLDQPGYWSGVMNGLHFFGDHAMTHLLEETKIILEARNNNLGVQWANASLSDLEHDNELLNVVIVLFARFHTIAPNSLQLISTYIRSYPQHFVQLRFEN